MRKFYKTLLIGLLIAGIGNAYGQHAPPINSNTLIEYGISPKVLDAALSPTLQEGAYKQYVHAEEQRGDKLYRTDFQFIYDPGYKDGIDIRVAYDKDSLGYLNSKQLLKMMQEMHSFSRLSKSYLYNESSLKIIAQTEDEIILSFEYDKTKLEPELKYGKKALGKIYIKNGELEKVELLNSERVTFSHHKIDPGDFKSTTYFMKAQENGGYIVSGYLVEYRYNKKNQPVFVKVVGETFEYVDNKNESLSWDGKPSARSVEEDLKVLEGSLGWALPLMGKGAKKLGYKLPRPIGMNLFVHQQAQVLEFTDISIGLNDSELVSLEGLFNYENSTVDQYSRVTMVKADAWILPFLNIMGVIGQGSNYIDGSLFLDDDLKEALIRFGFLVGLKPEDVPDYIPIKSELSALTYGGGVTLAGGVGDFNISLSYQIVASSVLEVNTTKLAHVIAPSLGYMTPIGVNIMAGAQGQFYNTNTIGFIPINDDTNLNYQVNFKPIRWNFIFGLYIPIANHFEVALQTGWGDRRSLTAVLGYRF